MIRATSWRDNFYVNNNEYLKETSPQLLSVERTCFMMVGSIINKINYNEWFNNKKSKLITYMMPDNII